MPRGLSSRRPGFSETDEMVPGKTLARTYRLEGNTVRRIGPSGGEAAAHPVVEEKKDKKGKKK